MKKYAIIQEQVFERRHLVAVNSIAYCTDEIASCDRYGYSTLGGAILFSLRNVEQLHYFGN